MPDRRRAGRLALDTLREPPGLWAVAAVDYAIHLAKSGPSLFLELAGDPVEAKLAAVQAPVLVVRGSRDAIVPRRWAEEMAARLPRGRLVEVSGAPHAVNYAAPEALARLTLRFLEPGEEDPGLTSSRA